MDPVTVVSLVAVSAQLLQQTVQVVTALNDARKQFENVPQTLTLMHMVCKMSLANIKKINDWIEGTLATSPDDQAYMLDLQEGLRDSTDFMESFQKTLGKYLEQSGSGKAKVLSWRLRAGFVWNEKDMRRHYEDITIISQHLQFLLNTTQLPKMLDRAADDNASLATSQRGLHRSSISLERELSMSRVYQNIRYGSTSRSVLSDDAETVWYIAPENFSGTNSQLRRTRSTSSLAISQLTSPPAMSVPSCTSRVLDASYGVLYRQRYSPQTHVGLKIMRDPFNGQLWAIDQIEWFLKKGDQFSVTDDSILGDGWRFQKRFRPGDGAQKMSVQIVISHEDRDRIPQSFKEGQGVQKLCEVVANLSEIESERQRGRWWNARSTYNVATFQLRAKLGSGSDVSFELLQNKSMYFRT